MPKRTNWFQRLIATIHEQLASEEGVRVVESAMVTERNSNRQHEVDILLEKEVTGYTVRIGLECRDRSRPADVTWINEIIGKFSSLDIHHKVAVSRSGFTRGAAEKAADNGIATLTLEEVRDIDWPSQFRKLGVSLISHVDYRLTEIKLELEPLLTGVLLEHPVVDETGEVVGTLKDLIHRRFNPLVRQRISELLRKDMLSVFKVRADLDKSLMVEISGKVSLPFLLLVNGTKHTIRKVSFRVMCTLTAKDVELQHFLYNKVQVSTGEIQGEAGEQDITIVQFADKNEAKVVLRNLDGE